MKKKIKILLTGGSGFLGLRIFELLRSKYNIISLYNKNKIKGYKFKAIKCDVNTNKISKIIYSFNPDIIIHGAALSSIEFCENNKKMARNTNYDSTKRILKFFGKEKKFIFISTDHIFDGKNKFYSEKSKTSPINQYAKTKVHSENYIQKNSKNFLIIRTNFFGTAKHKNYSFSDWIIKNLKSRNNINLFNNVYYTPIYIDNLIYCISKLIDFDKTGIFNICSDERVTKYHFGLMLSKVFNLNKKFIQSIKIEKLFKLVKRPKDMSLDNKKIKKIILDTNRFNLNKNIKLYKKNNKL